MARVARLGSEFFAQSTRRLATQLLGTVLVRSMPDGSRLSGIVVETEAYLSRQDQASHSFRGLGKKNASMFQQPGTLYVYPIHTRHCLNVVTEREGAGAAVLIRAMEPLEGIDRMQTHRHIAAARSRPASHVQLGKSLTSGPGRLCQALDVDRRLDGVDLVSAPQIWLEEPPDTTSAGSWHIRRTPRIGISIEKDLKLRYFVDGNCFVSGCARDHSAGRNWTFGEWDEPC